MSIFKKLSEVRESLKIALCGLRMQCLADTGRGNDAGAAVSRLWTVPARSARRTAVAWPRGDPTAPQNLCGPVLLGDAGGPTRDQRGAARGSLARDGGE